MRLYELKLSQPTVFALTISFLLIVMNLEQVHCKPEISFLYHGESRKFLTMHPNGSVTTDEGKTPYQCLVLSSGDQPRNELLKLSIYNPATKMYLCFNKRGILVGKRQPVRNCFFYDDFDETAHIQFFLATGKSKQNHKLRQRFVAFSRNGKPQKSNRKKKLTQFMKINGTSECSEYHQNETTQVSLRHSKHKRRHKP